MNAGTSLIIAMTALPVLAGCASSANGEDRLKGAERYAEDPRLGAQVDRICFAGSIDSFSMTERDTVVLDATGSKEYLVEVSLCPSLRTAQAIALDTSLSCVSRGDSLIVSDSSFGFDNSGRKPDRCLIRGMYAWDKKAEVAEE